MSSLHSWLWKSVFAFQFVTFTDNQSTLTERYLILSEYQSTLTERLAYF